MVILKENLLHPKNIIFVENKENFEKALSTSNYFDYFYDNFAGDFGHCTLKGNLLIAQQLADIVL